MSTSLNPLIETRNVIALKDKTGNLYESIAVVAKRSNQINTSLKEELHKKLDDFASSTDSLEEVHENKEQIDISKFYERMASPTLQALNEFMNDKIYYRLKSDMDDVTSGK